MGKFALASKVQPAISAMKENITGGAIKDTDQGRHEEQLYLGLCIGAMFMEVWRPFLPGLNSGSLLIEH